MQNTLDKGKHQNRIGYTEILPESQIANAVGYERLIREALRRRWRWWGSKENKPQFWFKKWEIERSIWNNISKRSAKTAFVADAVLAYLENNTQINKQCIKEAVKEAIQEMGGITVNKANNNEESAGGIPDDVFDIISQIWEKG